jgi:hypothetical protein
MLNILRFRVADVEVRPVYDREKSKIVLWKYIFKTSWILFTLFCRRMWRRYIVRDFHPLVLFLLVSLLIFFFLVIPFGIRFFYIYFQTGEAPTTTLMIFVSSLIATIQFALFALWMDMDYNSKYSGTDA